MEERSARPPVKASSIAVVAVVLGGLAVGGWFSMRDRAEAAVLGSLSSHRAASPSVAAANSDGGSATRADAGMVAAIAQRSAASSSAALLSPEAERQRSAALGLTRSLPGTNRVMFEGRERRVLGTKQIVNAAGQPETLLLVRDEVSGQIAYQQPGLHFTLKDGTDYEAFIRDHARTQRLFVNPLYGQVAVDAADIASVYNDMVRDPRVVRLRFLDREPVRKLK